MSLEIQQILNKMEELKREVSVIRTDVNKTKKQTRFPVQHLDQYIVTNQQEKK